jgi:hypothetical protein
LDDLLEVLDDDPGQSLAQCVGNQVLNASDGVLNDPALAQAKLFVVVIVSL